MDASSFFKLFKVSIESGGRWSFNVSPLPDPLIPSFIRSLELSHQDDHFNPRGFSKDKNRYYTLKNSVSVPSFVLVKEATIVHTKRNSLEVWC